MIIQALPKHADAIASIYNHYIKHTMVTFETEPVSAEDMTCRMRDCAKAELPWFVAIENEQVIGYAYASKWKGRCAYQYSVEATVYLSPSVVSKGWGTKLYQSLLSQLAGKNLHAVICGIALPNKASVALHEKLGMEKVAHFKQVGRKFDQWIDVGYWQRLLNHEDEMH
ncbi:arsinothricin resistance N-acetyltransferase ArsN1 family B [Thalassotalea sp. PP2-459]|uniref:arsinothricin resistance N-acetyltransferase ArsN1 family B n=1 Tax=Thalassotalea sp. PP2-459 TaxID=1742724 RepID=UPI000945038E|nr:arsinothricin resistance N-acetyltransferase ArsN1 family B [Thalassotalea sp. PP2-459]OKY25902.1 phosphinothricin acetyltransferase [Thalassotalea sp. PP2-459]